MKKLLFLLALLASNAFPNDYYTHSGYPAQGAAASSAAMRSELDLIQTGFDKMPTLTANANKAVVINGTGTAMTALSSFGVAQGGTGITSYTVGDILYASGATTLSQLADIATGNVLLTGGVGVAPSYGKVGLTTHVSGILPAANGGTGIAFFTAAGPSTGRTYTFPDANTTIAGIDTTQTLTNKRVTARIGTETSSATSTPTGDSVDQWNITALAAADAIAAPTGTPTDGQKLVIRILDNGTARALTFNAIYRASTDVPFPTTTVLSKTMYLGFVYNAAAVKWDLLCVVNGF